MIQNPRLTSIPYIRIIIGILLVCATIVAAGIVALSKTKEAVYDETAGSLAQHDEATENLPAPFPVSVNTKTQTINENPSVMPYLEQYLAADTVKPIRTSWIHKLTRKLAQLEWYQNLASPLTRILVIWPGERKEQITDNFGDILKWDETERDLFLALVTTNQPSLPDGTFFPGRYVVDAAATPETVAAKINERFADEIYARYPNSVEVAVPLHDALTIASLLEREAFTFSDMRIISGVIWNRLFADIPLQLDATLQFAKANNTRTATWWPVVHPRDKFIESPYNTYENKGLPPAPIANPSAAAILAALNPAVTDCMFYFHDVDGTMYCSVTYEAHKAKLERLYGHGQ